MPFTTIDTNSIDVGDPLKKELFDRIKDNFDDHESRISGIENQNAKVIVWDIDVLNSSSAATFTGLAYSEAIFDFNLIGCEIRIFEKGSLTGALEIDVKKSITGLDSTDFATIFTTKPKITLASASDYGRSTNQVFDNNQISISQGDTLRLDVTELPGSGIIGKFRVLLYGEV
jgi:hypothetical protein